MRREAGLDALVTTLTQRPTVVRGRHVHRAMI